MSMAYKIWHKAARLLRRLATTIPETPTFKGDLASKKDPSPTKEARSPTYAETPFI